VMAAGIWKHAASLDEMMGKKVRFYLDSIPGKSKLLSERKLNSQHFMSQRVDLKDRNVSNNDYYPDPIVKKQLDRQNGLFFTTAAFNKPTIVSGAIQGALQAVINKMDMDIGLVLYEITPKGEYFQLSYYLGRASYATDPTKRHLLRPGQLTQIPIDRSRYFSKLLQPGSKLLLVLNIDKNPFAQINYGSGKEVSTETIADAGEPLEIKWSSHSYIELGLTELP